MRLPNASQAIIDPAKLRDYCLNAAHPEGRHKARVFQAALGIGPQDADWLKTAILAALQDAEVVNAEDTPYGQRYDVDVSLSRAGLTTWVRTGWILRKSENVPRLATCYVRYTP